MQYQDAQLHQRTWKKNFWIEITDDDDKNETLQISFDINPLVLTILVYEIADDRPIKIVNHDSNEGNFSICNNFFGIKNILNERNIHESQSK